VPSVKQDSTAGAPDSHGRLAAIAEATGAFGDAVPDIDALLGIVAEQVATVTGDLCGVVLLSADAKTVEPVAAYHPNPEVMADAVRMLHVKLDIDAAGPWTRCLKERERVVIPIDPDNLPANLAPHQRRHIERWRMREAVMIPMVAQDRVVGGLNLSRMEGSRPLTPADQEFLDALAARAARAIATAQLLQSQRLLANELEGMVEERTRQLTEANQQLRIAEAEADRANRAKSKFLASMSHELRTPLNSIIGFSELLADASLGTFDEPTRKRFVGQIHSSGKHLLQLINDILDLSKVEAGQMDLHMQPVDLEPAVFEAVSTAEPLARVKAIELKSAVETGLGVVADPAKVKQMLLNLLSNAIKFTAERGTVTVAARRSGDWAELAVTDTGIGIAPADMGRLFGEFQQLEQGPGRRQEGTGLGLALTKRFAELHGGTVTVESEVGRGSTFTIRLPMTAGAYPTAPARAPAPDVEADRPLVLVVDDNLQAAEILGRHLDSGGFRHRVARSGTEALQLAADLRPMAVTLDILLPEIDGWEVMTRLKENPATRNIPVVVVSVVDKPALGRALGAIDYFVKPVDGKALLSRLEQYTFTTKAKRSEVRVLVVDDEPANLDMVASLLEPAGFTVLKAGGGQEGIDLARSQLPSLILLDLMMPGVNGFDVVEQLRADEKTRPIPVMVLTSKTLTVDEKKDLNRNVAAIFERNSVAGAELTEWLRSIAYKISVSAANPN
jgi:signal transduction histidine kinase/DNA-binding response OmpR family regulator